MRPVFFDGGTMTGMAAVLVKATAYICIIISGYLLKKKGIFKQMDFFVLSRMILTITLPCATITTFSKNGLDASMLVVSGLAFLANWIMVGIAFCVSAGKTQEERTFNILNIAGYNVGTFTIPFVQNFLGATGFVTTSLFAAGNALMCMGITYSIAAAVRGKEKPTVSMMLKKLVSSIPFDCYVIMIILSLAQIRLPEIVISFASTAGSANAFLALFMIGIGFELHADKEKLCKMAQILAVRFGMGILFALAFYFLLPLPLEVRQALAIVPFAPAASPTPAYCGKLDCDVELSSALTSMEILISIVSIVVILMLIL